jgi:muramoyltetrapeptide carboxypeptidase
MRIPPFLHPGDTVGLTCTARSITLEELQPAIEILESWGFDVRIGSSVGLVDHQFGGTDAERASSFQELLDDVFVKAIFVCRGGYGTVRIMDLIEYSTFFQNPKWIVGFSDVTVLHSNLNSQLHIASLHAAMPSVYKDTLPESLITIKQALVGEPLKYMVASHPLNRNGICSGELVGGNLSLIYSLLGTKTDIETKDKILFLEDLDEYLYHIDRMMMSLKRAGKLDHLAGLVVGGMTEMRDNIVPFGKTAEEIILEHVREYKYPVCFGFPAGHYEDNRAIILGAETQLLVENDQVTFKQIN